MGEEIFEPGTKRAIQREQVDPAVGDSPAQFEEPELRLQGDTPDFAWKGVKNQGEIHEI